jgi:hypothetical protein
MVDYEKILNKWFKYTECKEAVAQLIKIFNEEGWEFRGDKIQEIAVNTNENLTGKKRLIEGTWALCFLQTPEYRLWVTVTDSKKVMSFEAAETWAESLFSGKGYLPESAEIMWLWQYYGDRVSITDEKGRYWTNDEYRVLNWCDSFIIDNCNGTRHYALAFYQERLT